MSCYHGNTRLGHCRKNVLCWLTMRQAFTMNSTRIVWILRKQFCNEGFSPIFCTNFVTMAMHFLPLPKYAFCTLTSSDEHLCQISWKMINIWGRSSRHKSCPHFVHNMLLICHGNILSGTVEKKVLHIYTIRNKNGNRSKQDFLSFWIISSASRKRDLSTFSEFSRHFFYCRNRKSM